MFNQFRTIFASIFHQFSWLFRHRFSHRFVHRFLMENGSKMAPKIEEGTLPEPHLFAIFSKGRYLDAFWSPFGSFWAPFWLPLAPFWLPLAPFWHPLAHFWRPLAPFVSLYGPVGFNFLILVDFGALLALFDSLLRPFRILFLIFWHLLILFSIFSDRLASKPKPSAKKLEINTCTVTSYRFSHTSIFAGPGRINCRRQLRSTFFRTLQKPLKKENKSTLGSWR